MVPRRMTRQHFSIVDRGYIRGIETKYSPSLSEKVCLGSVGPVSLHLESTSTSCVNQAIHVLSPMKIQITFAIRSIGVNNAIVLRIDAGSARLPDADASEQPA